MRLVVNATTGEVKQKIEYDACPPARLLSGWPALWWEYGNVTFDTNPDFQPFAYAGGLYDSQTKLVRFGARDYDASIGRWTCKDPIGFKAGLNFYVYCGNDPINWFDPSGLVEYASEYNTTREGLSEDMTDIEGILDQVFWEYADREAIVTYTTNGKHSKNSLHYTGNAIDLRVRDMTEEQKQKATEELQYLLGDDYDIINEGDHIHCEYDPKK